MTKTREKKNDRYELRLSGSGGQGIILAAVVLAEAAGVYDGKYVCQTQSYGPESRGGYSKAEVVISSQAIDYPRAMKPDLLLAMNQTAHDAYLGDLKADGLLVADATLVAQMHRDRAVAIPFTQIARNDLGNEIVANMVALGAVGLLCQRVSRKGLESSLKARTPKGLQQLNLKALRAGFKAAEKIDLDALPRSVAVEEEEI